jgi:hypothetical protein
MTIGAHSRALATSSKGYEVGLERSFYEHTQKSGHVPFTTLSTPELKHRSRDRGAFLKARSAVSGRQLAVILDTGLLADI